MNDDLAKKWEDFFTPSVVRHKLISASLFLAAFELLRESIVERIKTFHCNGFNKNGFTYDEEYNDKVLSLHKRPLTASTMWLLSNNIINEQDSKKIEEIIRCRNIVAHELPKILYDDNTIDYLALLPDLTMLLKKIEIWWIANVEIPTNPDLDGQEINEEEISTGALMALAILGDMALGTEEDANRYLTEFHKFMAKKP